MRSVEGILLQVILQGDSVTYYCVAFCNHATPHHVAPCCTHHHYVASHHASLIMIVPITVLHCVPLLHHVAIVTYVLAAPCLLVVPSMLLSFEDRCSGYFGSSR